LFIFSRGNDAEALIRYAQALKLFSDLNNRKAMASIYNNIGNIHLLGERYEEAIENYKQSVQSIGFLNLKFEKAIDYWKLLKKSLKKLPKFKK
jgi:tetratricopeptide (TPR) repeat protein